MALSRRRMQEFLSRLFGEPDLAAVFVDAKFFHEQYVLTALGVDSGGRKQVLGLLDAERRFRRVRGFRYLPCLMTVLDDQQERFNHSQKAAWNPQIRSSPPQSSTATGTTPAQECSRKVASKKQIVRLLHVLAETMEIPPHQLAAAALEYANGVFGAADDLGDTDAIEDEALNTEGGARDTDLPAVPQVEPYTGSLHLCLDFGTAMSKACAWDKESDTPMPLRVGHAAGEPASSPYALNSAIFISREERVFFGQKAVNLAAAADPERHRAFESIKDILTVGQMTDLRDPVPDLYNPTKHPVNRKEAVALYLAFLTDSALLALREDHQECSRNIPRSYTKPVFDRERDEWATKILDECAPVGQALADRYSGQWEGGIPLHELRTVFEEASSRKKHAVVESGILSEPVAAFASRIRNLVPEGHKRHLMMVVDVGAGTTGFAMFARIEREGDLRLHRIMHSVTTIRVAGDAIDNALIDYLLNRTDVTEGLSQLGAIRVDLQRDIRLVKEELFRNKFVTRPLVNDMKAEAKLEEFEECPAMVRLRDAMQEKFEEVLSGIDESWLSLRELQVFFTGGGASLNMVRRLAGGHPVRVGASGKRITPVGVERPPRWLVEECEEVVDAYPQLAVCIGGACHGAGKTHLGVERERETFGGDLPDVEFRLGGFRDGQVTTNGVS